MLAPTLHPGSEGDRKWDGTASAFDLNTPMAMHRPTRP